MKTEIIKKKKEVTLNDLAIMIQRGFSEQDKKFGKEFDKVGEGFKEVNKRLDEFEERLIKVEKAVFEMQLDISDIKQNLRNLDKVLILLTQAVNVLKINDMDLESRVERLEIKMGLV